MNDINTSFNNTSGVNPESDLSHITLEYDSVSDKFYLDTGEIIKDVFVSADFYRLHKMFGYPKTSGCLI